MQVVKKQFYKNMSKTFTSGSEWCTPNCMPPPCASCIVLLSDMQTLTNYACTWCCMLHTARHMQHTTCHKYIFRNNPNHYRYDAHLQSLHKLDIRYFIIPTIAA